MKRLLLFSIAIFFATNIAFAQDDPFEGRPTIAGPGVASVKENIPNLKESFRNKLARYKREGFKVAVVLYSADITTKQVDPVDILPSGTIGLNGTVPSIKTALDPLANKVAASLNETFGTDIFEVVDLSTIPYRQAKWGKVDDWGATKYKTVFIYNANPVYDYSFIVDKYKAELTVALSIVAIEYVNEKTGVQMKFPLRVGNLGLYKSPAYETEEKPNITTTEELHILVNPPLGEDLLGELMKLQDASLPGIIKRLKK